jgi:segregation and condensation protein A
VDIFEVPLARITDRYLAAVRTMEFFDINVAAEFLVVAATLMEIKSKTLLPPDPAAEEEDEDDPGVELVRRLIEYKEFREAAEHLGERATEQAHTFPRPRSRPADDEAEQDEPESLLGELAVWDLMAAFAEVVEQTRIVPSTRIIHGDVPLSVCIDEVLRTVRLARGPVDFLDFFRLESTRPRVVGIFLALLELYRRRLILVTEAGGTLQISLREPEDDCELRIADCGFEGERPPDAEAISENRQPSTDNSLTVNDADEGDDDGRGPGAH